MDNETILVLGPPAGELLVKLQSATGDAALVLGTTPEDFARAAPQATVVLAWNATRDLLKQVAAMAPGARWVHIMSAGLNHVLSPELEAHPAVITNGRGVFSSSLGEWVLGAILYFAKDFRRLMCSQAEHRWDPFDVVEVSGQTVGIVGYGDIGRAVATRARAMGMRVLGLTRRGPSPDRPDDLAEEVFGPGERIRMIEQCDYLVVTAPLTPDTRGLIGEAEIAALKPSAVIVNVGRGPVVAEEPLLRALTQKTIKGAALDVFHREPLPADDPLWALDNVLLSPHCADHTSTWLDNALDLFLENLGRYRRGESLANVVEKGRGY